jgi:hypothetical protein
LKCESRGQGSGPFLLADEFALNLRILLLEPTDEAGARQKSALEERGHTVTWVRVGAEANRVPQHFDCGVFSGEFAEGNGVALAGWFLAENRVRSVVFVSDSLDASVRVRASNLGGWVLRSEGTDELCNAVADNYDSAMASAEAAGAEGEPLTPRSRELKSGSRPKRR